MSCGEITKWSERKEPRRLTRLRTHPLFAEMSTGRRLAHDGEPKITLRQHTQRGTTRIGVRA